MNVLSSKKLNLAYGNKIILKDFDIEIKKGEIISLIGPNGSGKSTFLAGIAKLIKADNECLFVSGKDINVFSFKEMSKTIAFVHQGNPTIEDMKVEELVECGRAPYKSWYNLFNQEDEDIVMWALKETKMYSFKDRKLSTLSGGERQKVWIATALAQKTDFLILDESTTYLDICHQLEILELIKYLNKKLGITVLMVLHDINQASQYSDKILVLKNGEKQCFGSPSKVLNETLIQDVYGVVTEKEVKRGYPFFKILGLYTKNTDNI